MADVICGDIFGKKHTIPTSELRWRPSAYGVVIRGDTVLLCKHLGKYNIPGGGLDLGEKPEAAVIREVKEETGIDVQNPRLIAVDSDFFRFSHTDNSCIQAILIYYICDFVGGTLSTDGFGKDEKQYAEIAEWVPLTSLDSLEITSTKDYRKYIRQALGLRK